MSGDYENYDLLIVRVRQGDNFAWKQLHNLLLKHIYAYALQEAKNQQTAEDVVQEGFIVVFQQIAHLLTFEDVRKMLFIVVRNKCRDYIRKHKYQQKMLDELGDVFQAEELKEYEHTKKNEIKKAIEKLPKTTRQIIELSYFHGYNSKEIAGIMKLSKLYVKKRRMAGRRKLKHLLTSSK